MVGFRVLEFRGMEAWKRLAPCQIPKRYASEGLKLRPSCHFGFFNTILPVGSTGGTCTFGGRWRANRIRVKGLGVVGVSLTLSKLVVPIL